MIGAGDTAVAQRVWRQRRSVAEKLRIVRLTFEPDASVAEVARKQGVNANQLFKWRRLFERGQLGDAGAGSTALLPVIVSGSADSREEASAAQPEEQASAGGSIHIEFPGRAMISVECGADPVLVRSVLESLRK
jgi:transposase